MSDYGGQYLTHEGSKYVDGRHPNETNKLVRAEVAAAVKSGLLPSEGVKYSVTRAKGGWQSINLTVMVQDGDVDAWALISRADPSDPCCPRQQWTAQARRAGHVLHKIADQYVRNTTDSQTDYFAGGYVMVYVNDAQWGPGGGLCVPRFTEYDVAPKWTVSKRAEGGWWYWATSTMVEGDVCAWTDRWEDAMKFAREAAQQYAAVA